MNCYQAVARILGQQLAIVLIMCVGIGSLFTLFMYLCNVLLL